VSETTSTPEPAARHQRRLPWLGVVAIVVIVVAATAGGALYTNWKQDRDDRAALRPIVAAMNAFPAPSGPTPAAPQFTKARPLEAVNIWRSDVGLDATCQKWKEAFRSWIGDAAVTGSVSGEDVPGRSCAFAGRRGKYLGQLHVAAYADNAPLITLSLTP
jgi:hypothetical protein